MLGSSSSVANIVETVVPSSNMFTNNAHKMLPKHANARFPGPHSDSKALQIPKKCSASSPNCCKGHRKRGFPVDLFGALNIYLVNISVDALNILDPSPQFSYITSSFQHLTRATPKKPRPRPFLLVMSTLAPAELRCSTTAPWPLPAAQCNAVSPRRRGCETECGKILCKWQGKSVDRS
jgi:hypothetical protein